MAEEIILKSVFLNFVQKGTGGFFQRTPTFYSANRWI